MVTPPHKFKTPLLPLLVPLCPTFYPAKVSLNGSTSFWCVSNYSQLSIICKLADGAAYYFIQVTDKDNPVLTSGEHSQLQASNQTLCCCNNSLIFPTLQKATPSWLGTGAFQETPYKQILINCTFFCNLQKSLRAQIKVLIIRLFPTLRSSLEHSIRL